MTGASLATDGVEAAADSSAEVIESTPDSVAGTDGESGVVGSPSKSPAIDIAEAASAAAPVAAGIARSIADGASGLETSGATDSVAMVVAAVAGVMSCVLSTGVVGVTACGTARSIAAMAGVKLFCSLVTGV